MVMILDSSYLNCFIEVSPILQLLTRAVYTTETTAMTGIEITIGSPVAETKIIINRLTCFNITA